LRDRVLQEWTADKGEALKEKYYANLRDSYSIVIEQPAVADKAAAVPEQSGDLAVAPEQSL